MPEREMTIEQFLRGAFDVGHEAAVIAQTHGPGSGGFYRISVYRNADDVYYSEYRQAEGETWEEALAAWEAAAWTESTADSIKHARERGGWGND